MLHACCRRHMLLVAGILSHILVLCPQYFNSDSQAGGNHGKLLRSHRFYWWRPVSLASVRLIFISAAILINFLQIYFLLRSLADLALVFELEQEPTLEVTWHFVFIDLLQLRVRWPTTLKFNTWHFVNTRNEKSRKKISRTAKFDVCSIEI